MWWHLCTEQSQVKHHESWQTRLPPPFFLMLKWFVLCFSFLRDFSCVFYRTEDGLRAGVRLVSSKKASYTRAHTHTNNTTEAFPQGEKDHTFIHASTNTHTEGAENISGWDACSSSRVQCLCEFKKQTSPYTVPTTQIKFRFTYLTFIHTNKSPHMLTVALTSTQSSLWASCSLSLQRQPHTNPPGF